MTSKRYWEIVHQYNSHEVLYIVYGTKHSKGKITCSIAFFLEMYKKFSRLLKKVDISHIFLRDEETGIVVKYFMSLEHAREWSLYDHK